MVLLSLRSDLPSDVEASFSDVRTHPLSSSEAYCQEIPNLALITLKALHNPFDDVSQVYVIRAFSLGKKICRVCILLMEKVLSRICHLFDHSLFSPILNLGLHSRCTLPPKIM